MQCKYYIIPESLCSTFTLIYSMIFFMVNCVSKINVARCLLSRICFGLTSHWPASYIYARGRSGHSTMQHQYSTGLILSWNKNTHVEKKRTDHFICWLLYPVSFPITTSMIMMIFIQRIAYSYSFLRSLVFSLSKHLTGIIEYAHVYMFAFVFEWFGTDSDTMWHMPALKWSMEAHFMTLAHKRTHARFSAMLGLDSLLCAITLQTCKCDVSVCISFI